MKPYLPFLSLLCTAIFALFVDLFRSEQQIVNRGFWAIRCGLWGIALTVFLYVWLYQDGWLGASLFPDRHLLFNVWGIKLSLLVTMLAFLVLYQSGPALVKEQVPIPEYVALYVFSLLGACVLIAAGSLLTLYLGLELLSLPAYALLAMCEKSPHSHEASMKYFVLGVLASSFILYGFSLLYGLTGTLDLQSLTQSTPAATPDVMGIAFLSAVLVVAGLAFKFGVAPFHFWLPDVYQGAPAVTALFLSVVPKVAIFSFFLKIIMVWPVSMDLRQDLVQVLSYLGALSIFWGNLAALHQENLRRMLAYSAVAHAGFLFLAFSVWFAAGADNTVFSQIPAFYLVAYILSTLSAFGLLLHFATHYDIESLDDLKGLYYAHPVLSFFLLLTFLSLAGIPPLLGFYAKFYVLSALIDLQYWALAACAILGSAIGLYYYLRVICYVYFTAKEEGKAFIPWSGLQQACATACIPVCFTVPVLALQASLLLLLGIFPNWLSEWLLQL